MTEDESTYDERCKVIHLLRSQESVGRVAELQNRSESWVYKWQRRFQQEGWSGLQSRSRARKHHPTQLPESVYQTVRTVRSELELEATQPGKLCYVGAGAIRARLRQQQVTPLPSISSIERELRRSGMVSDQQSKPSSEVIYPQLRPTEPHQLVQVDIAPHFLPGGPCISCFNAIDVVSRYATGQQFMKKRSEDAVAFLLHLWKELGIPTYTQVDNEACFSGGFTHRYVLGRVVRTALYVGTQLIFSPFYHPKSNAVVERFHQEYDRNVWDKVELADLDAVHIYSPLFFAEYRMSQHQRALQDRSPMDLHTALPSVQFPVQLVLPSRPPLTVGKVHFMRVVDSAQQVSVLNVAWDVASAIPGQGVWVTLDLAQTGAKLHVFDAAPDQRKRHRLATHSFPVKEPILPLQPSIRSQYHHRSWWQQIVSHAIPSSLLHDVLKVYSVVNERKLSTMS